MLIVSIATVLLAVLAYHISPSLAIGLLVLLTPLWGLVLFFFRDPERPVPAGQDLILSPADGKVVAIESVHEPHFIRGPALRISIFMSILDVHVNRSPVEGQVSMLRHAPGKFLQAFRPEAADVNEHMLMGLQVGGERVLIKQIAGILARRCVNYASIDDVLQRGQRFGMIRFSSRVDLFLPPDVQIRTRVGEQVHGGVSILAEWHS